MASYPSSTKSFATHTGGQQIASADINAIQDEVVALENGLRTGVAHDLIPDADNTRDLGSAAKQWNDAFLGGRLVSPSLDVDTTGFVNSATQPRARVYRSTAQTISDTTLTALTFDTEDFDVGAMHDTGSNTSRLTVPTGGDGLYLIIAGISWAANATGFRELIVKKNGTTFVGGSLSQNVGAGASTAQQAVAAITLAATDYVEAFVQQTSGGALATANNPNTLDFFSIVKLW